MMSFSSYLNEFKYKRLKLGFVFCLGLGAFGFAQTPLSNPPPPSLPPLPGIPAVAAPAAPNAPNSPTSLAVPPVPAIPGLPALPDLAAVAPVAATASATKPARSDAAKPADVGVKPTPEAAPPKLADLPSPTLELVPDKPGTPVDLEAAIAKAEAKKAEEASLKADAQKAPGDEQGEEDEALSFTTPPEMPLPLPPIGTTDIKPVNAAVGVMPLPETKAAKPKEKTWSTTLAPARTYLSTSFKYKRNLLPDMIYRASYEEYNQHLPKAKTRQDYERLLFESASVNNVEYVRALLNAGTDINAKDAVGATPLMVARAYGATAAEQLLIARGAK